MLRRQFLRLATAFALSGVLLTTACASGGGGRVVSSGNPASVVIVNNSNETIFRIHMSPRSQPNWGPDHLGSSVLSRGQSFTLTNVAAGRWDIRIVDRSGNYKEFRNQQFNAGRSYTLRVNSGGWTRGS